MLVILLSIERALNINDYHFLIYPVWFVNEKILLDKALAKKKMSLFRFLIITLCNQTANNLS